jgi:hypothetical protein
VLLVAAEVAGEFRNGFRLLILIIQKSNLREFLYNTVSLKSLSLPSSVVVITYTTRFHLKQVRTRPHYATLTAHLHHLMSRDVRFVNILRTTKIFLTHAPYLSNRYTYIEIS